MRLDKSLWNLNTPGTLNYATLMGFNSSDSVILSATNVLETDFPPIGEPTYYKGCQWTCIADNYSYRIQQFKRLDNPDQGHYTIQPAFHLDDEGTGTQIPYYRYFDNAEIVNYTNNFGYYNPSGGITGYDSYGEPIYDVPIDMNPAFHGIPDWSSPIALENSINFYKFEQYDDENSNITYKASNGSVISAPFVYALRKYTGWWRSGGIRVPGNGDYNINNDCLSHDITWAIGQINGSSSNLAFIQSYSTPYPNFDYHPDNVRDLFCTAPVGGGTTTLNPFSYWDCIYAAGFFDNIADGIEDAQDATSYWEYLAAVADCNESAGSSGNGGGPGTGVTPDDIISNIEYLGIERFGASSDSLIRTYFHSDLIDSLGNYIQTSNQILEPGLYKMSFKFPLTDLGYIIFENKKRVNSTLPLSSFLDATIFPVPLQDDYKFSINLTTTARSEFTYELLDFNGNLVYTKNFLLEKDHDKDHLIISDVQIPTGLLLNRFIFNDGSSFTITTSR